MREFLTFVAVFGSFMALVIGGVYIGDSLNEGAGRWLAVTVIAVLASIVHLLTGKFAEMPVWLRVIAAILLIAMITRTLMLLV